MPAPTIPACSRCAQIYNYYKKFDIATEVMGASFRNIGQIVALAGCDLLTISPELLAELQRSEAPFERALDPRARAPGAAARGAVTTRPSFRYALNADAMATEKLAEGIRGFAADAAKLDALIEARVAAAARPRPQERRMNAPRCDRTPAWAALAGHFEAHGRDFDLRDAFARDPGRFDQLRRSRRRRSSPTCRRT